MCAFETYCFPCAVLFAIECKLFAFRDTTILVHPSAAVHSGRNQIKDCVKHNKKFPSRTEVSLSEELQIQMKSGGCSTFVPQSKLKAIPSVPWPSFSLCSSVTPVAILGTQITNYNLALQIFSGYFSCERWGTIAWPGSKGNPTSDKRWFCIIRMNAGPPPKLYRWYCTSTPLDAASLCRPTYTLAMCCFPVQNAMLPADFRFNALCFIETTFCREENPGLCFHWKRAIFTCKFKGATMDPGSFESVRATFRQPRKRRLKKAMSNKGKENYENSSHSWKKKQSFCQFPPEEKYAMWFPQRL